jgi:lysine decarboxylase
MADADTVVFLATLADGSDDFDVLSSTLVAVLRTLTPPGSPPPRQPSTALSWCIVPQRAMSMRTAYFSDTEMVSAAGAIGRVSADLIAPYPPGVAVVAPGELLTEEILRGLAADSSAGVRIAYATDPTLNTFRVVIPAAAACSCVHL